MRISTATRSPTLTPQRLAVAGATVTLVEQGTQATLTRTTGSSGEVAFSFVPVGGYTLKVDAQGFKTEYGDEDVEGGSVAPAP